jgi:hypothetical protein
LSKEAMKLLEPIKKEAKIIKADLNIKDLKLDSNLDEE